MILTIMLSLTTNETKPPNPNQIGENQEKFVLNKSPTPKKKPPVRKYLDL